MKEVKVGRRRVSISNPDKVLFPQDGITKRDLIEYHVAVGDLMLPEIRDRLLTLERYPDGIGADMFFQKGVSKYFPDWISRKTVPKKGGTVTHPVVTEKATLVYMANQAGITPHMSLARVDDLDHPDQMIFDLDPSTPDFDLVRRTALRFHELLEDIGLYAVVKVSGSRGLHVTVPLDRSASYEEVRTFARDAAGYMVEEAPDELTVEVRKVERGDRLFLDWMRNTPAQTIVAPYGVRARPGAPVAMPISWEEVRDRKLTAQRYSIVDARREVESGRNDWSGWRRHARSLTRARPALTRLASS